MTQVEPFSRRPRRADADERYGEQRPGYPQGGSGRGDDRYDSAGGRGAGPDAYDDPREDALGSGGYDPRPSNRGGNGGYDPRPSNRSSSVGDDPRPGRPSAGEAYDPRPKARGTDLEVRDSGGAGRPMPSRQAAPLPVLGDEGDRRGSHATTYGQGFSWVVAWTILGALLPGLGLIAAGWRRLGAAVLATLTTGALLIAIWALSGNVLKRGMSFAVDPQRLLFLAIAATVIGLLWALVILLTNSQLRRWATLDGGQKVFSWVVVAALLVGVGVPTYTVGDYALVQRDLIKSVFNNDGDEDADDQKPDTAAADPWADTKRVNVLLIGSDAGSTRKGIRPDTMILASIQPSSGNTVLFSLPRNLERVPFKEGTPGAAYWPDGYWCEGHACMINAVWRWAEDTPDSGYHKFRNPGLKATEDAVTGVTGLKIDTYAMLNLKGFQDFIDAIGGVELDVKERLPIGGNSTHPVAKDWIEVGNNQQMDGYHALWFARSRWSTTDYDRMERQRCVIAAVSGQSDPVTLAKNFPKIARALKENMQTGIKQNELQAWVDLATRVQGAKTTSLPFTDKVVADRANPDYDLIHQQVRKAITKSENQAKRAKATATPGPSANPSASPGTGTDGPKKPKKPKVTGDPTDAQDVAAVC